MDHPEMKQLASLAGVIVLCATFWQSCAPIKDLYQQELARSRTPGQHMVESAEETMKKHCCPPYQWNVLYLEEAGTVPERLSPGDEVNHRIRYAFCPRVSTQVMKARLVRKVLYRGKEVFRDVSNQGFCAGTWDVDAFIKVPHSASSGWYVIKLEIYCPDRTIKRTCTFYVKGKGSQAALAEPRPDTTLD